MKRVQSDREIPTSQERTRTTRREPGAPWFATSAVLAVIAFCAFVPVLFNGFVGLYDDGLNFLGNPYYRGLGRTQIVWAWTTILVGVYQPLSWMVLELEYVLWGLDAWGYHLVSVIFHVLVTVALFRLTVAVLERVGTEDRRWSVACAGLATALFAVHPLRTEVVAWVSCQPYLPSIFCMILALTAYLRAHPAEGPTRVGWLVGSWLLSAVALLFKATAMTIPALLLVLDVYPLRRLGGRSGWFVGRAARSVWWEKLPFLALSAGFMAIAVHARKHGIHLRTLHDGVGARITQACYAVCFYVLKSIWPAGLAADYPLPSRDYAREPVFIASVVAVVAITAVVVALRRRWPGLLAAWAVFAITVAPNSGLLRVTDQVATDRYSYLPTMAGVMVVAYALSRLGGSAVRRRAIVGGTAAVTVVFMACTWWQCRTWRDEITFFSRVAAVSPDAPRPLVCLGVLEEQQGRRDEAERCYVRARTLDPRFPFAANALGLLRLREKRYQEAEAFFREAIDDDPTFAEANLGMGLLYARQERWGESIPWYEKALRLDPGAYEAHRNLAEALEKLGRRDEAIRHYLTTLELDPYNRAALDAVSRLK